MGKKSKFTKSERNARTPQILYDMLYKNGFSGISPKEWNKDKIEYIIEQDSSWAIKIKNHLLKRRQNKTTFDQFFSQELTHRLIMHDFKHNASFLSYLDVKSIEFLEWCIAQNASAVQYFSSKDFKRHPHLIIFALEQDVKAIKFINSSNLTSEQIRDVITKNPSLIRHVNESQKSEELYWLALQACEKFNNVPFRMEEKFMSERTLRKMLTIDLYQATYILAEELNPELYLVVLEFDLKFIDEIWKYHVGEMGEEMDRCAELFVLKRKLKRIKKMDDDAITSNCIF